MADMEELELKLNLIGWKLRNAGCHHKIIVNEKGVDTSFVLFDERIRLDVIGSFGEEDDAPGKSGHVSFRLRDSEIKVSYDGGKDKKPTCVVVHKAGEENPGNFIQFYNHGE